MRILRHAGTSLLMLLCLCVILQMLGVPSTLLNPAFDAVESSVFEGFALLPAHPGLPPLSPFAAITDLRLAMHMPLLAETLFHPPVFSPPVSAMG
jgi:hypothetical protein